MEHAADDIEILDELLDEAPPEPAPIHRFQGIFLFFSISLGALGLGASLAYFTREMRPARRATHRVTRAARSPAPSTPGLRELVTLPLKPALDAGSEEARHLARRRPAPGPTRPIRTPVTLAVASTLDPTRPKTKAAMPPRSTPGGADRTGATTASTAPPAAALPVTAASLAATPPSTSGVAAPLPREATPQRLDPAASAEARKLLGAIAGLLEARYAFESQGLRRLAGGEEALERKHEVALPTWMNLVYLERLVGRALAQSELDREALTVETGRFGSGTLRVALGDAESPGLSLTLVKPAAQTQVALVVDDVGYGGSSTKELLDLQAPFSVAILPFYPGSTWSLKTSIEKDLEPMLHLPMLPKGAIGKYRNNVVIGPDLPAEEILRRARRAIDSLPGIVGVNNHMGSRATESWFVMGEVLPVIREKGLFFVDSVTSNRSVAFRSARKLGLKTAKRTTAFLDNDPSYEGVKKAFSGLLGRCKPGQRHVAILHDKHDSVRAMREAIPLFRDRDIELAFAGDMVE